MKNQVKFVKKGIVEPIVKIKLGGVDYYASHYISSNYQYKKNVMFSSVELRRMFDRLREKGSTVVFDGVTYYDIDLEKRGW